MEIPKVGNNWFTRIIDSQRRKSLEGDYVKLTSFLEYDPQARLLDVGCGLGTHTKQFAKSVGTQDVTGLEMRHQDVSFELVVGYIDDGLPFKNESFDVVTASHIIEHVTNTDLLVQEMYRVLKPKGYTVIATPNLASGKTIAQLLYNKQPDDAHISDFFLPRNFPNQEWARWWTKYHSGSGHRRLFTMEGLVKLLTHYGFEVEHKMREGYGIFTFGKILRGLYAANLIVKARKR